MAASRRKRHHEEEHENHERWLVSYADMVTLLMVLFIVLFAMSQVDQRKFYELKASLSEGFGQGQTLADGGTGLLAQGASMETPAEPSALSPEDLAQQAMPDVLPKTEQQDAADDAANAELERLEEVRRAIEAALAAHNMQDAVSFRYDERGLHVTIVTDEVLFGLGEADLRPEGRVVLDVVGPTLVPLPNQVSVDGHTDDRPISSGAFPSNWELSTARATTVLRYLVDHHGLPAQRVSASGFADQRPVVPHDTPEHRQTNRRVEVVVLTAPVPADSTS